MAASPSRAWRGQFGSLRGRPALPVFLPLPADFYQDSCHGEDSGFAALSDSDASAGTDGGVLLLADSDSGQLPASDLEASAFPGSGDLCAGADAGGWSGPLSDPVPDTGTGTDGPSPVTFQVAGAEACAGAEGSVLGVYTFQPPFRFTGGGFSLVMHATRLRPPGAPRAGADEVREFTLWHGARPDGTALRLYAAFAAGRLHFLSDGDRSGSREEGEAASLQVTVHIAPSLAVGLEVS